MTKSAIDRRAFLALGAVTLASRALAPRALAQAAPGLPFQVIKGKIFIDVTLGGRVVQAMIDSGASYSGIDERLAESLGIVARGRGVSLRHVQGVSNGRWVDGVSLTVAGVAQTRSMVVTDFGLLTASVLHPIVVLLGADFLGAYVAHFDFDAGRLTLHERAGFASPPEAALIPLARPRGLVGAATPMTAPVVVEGTTIQALVDTGSLSSLIVAPQVARRLGLLQGRAVSTSPIGGIGGVGTGRITTLKTLALGPRAFTDVPVQVTARPLARVDANLGLEVLSRFNLWLDLAGRRMWTSARVEQPPFAKNMFGFFGIPDGDGDFRVTFVADASPAQRSGLKEGDIITRINGGPANAALVALTDPRPGTELNLVLEGGRALSLTLATYY